jgi:UDP-glucose 4-epimerase
MDRLQSRRFFAWPAARRPTIQSPDAAPAWRDLAVTGDNAGLTPRCIVTGGAGFIGSHLTERLLADGHEVVVVDDLSTGRLENLGTVASDARLHAHEADVADPGALSGLVGRGDWVFHLAALADIVPSIERPLEYHRANVDGTVNVVEAARQAEAARFIYAASSSCYGIPDVYPTPESAPPRPQYPYALTKWLGEQYVLHWAQVYKLPVTSLRLFNVYGPRSRTSGSYGAVFGVFLAQKLAGKPFTVVGDGTQSRDFTFVSDVVDAFVRAASTPLAPGGQVINVGTGNDESVNRIVELLQPEAGTVALPKRPGEPDRTLADNTRAREQLAWSPQVSLAEGVGVLLDNIDHWREAPVWDKQSIEEATEQWFTHLSHT